VKRETRQKLIGWGLRALGPAILIVLIARLDRPADLLEAAKRVAPWPLALAVALNAIPLWLKVLRWQLILRARGIRYGTRDAWLAFSASLYLGMLTPGRVGDVLRIRYLRHDTGARYAEGLASVVLDRLADLYVLVGFVAAAVAHWGGVLSPRLALVSWLLVASCLALPLVLMVPGTSDAVLTRLYRRVAREPEADGMAVFLESLRTSAKRSALPMLVTTLAAFSVNFLQGKLLADAMGLHLSIFDVVSLQSVQSLLGLMPISVSGLGVREAFYAAVFPGLGHTAEQGASYGLLVFLVMYVAQVVIGAVAWQLRPPPVGAVKTA